MPTLSTPTIVRALLPAGTLALWGGLLEAKQRFPGEFDWRYMTVSRLLSARDDPAGFAWAIAGMEVCGLAILLWSVVVASTRADGRRGTRSIPGLSALRWGGIGMMASALVPLRLPALPKLHEALTIVAFIGLCLGVIWIVRDGARRLVAPHWGLWRRSLLGRGISALLVTPVALACFVQGYIFFLRPDLHWVGLAWRSQGVPEYLSFAFWEWLTCALLTLYLLACSVMAGPPVRSVGVMSPDDTNVHTIRVARQRGPLTMYIKSWYRFLVQPSTGTGDGLRARALLADDHPGMLVALRRIIEESCDVVGQVTTGGAVLDAVLRLRPEIVILDMSLPEINGLDLCCQIKDVSPATVVVFVTAIDDAEIKAEALRLGAAALVQKSAIATDLVATIDVAISRSREAGVLSASNP